jgi:CelD/BcsL family acetyltransferase involved in cellulose biosynthesis
LLQCAASWRELAAARKTVDFYHHYEWYAAYLTHLRPAEGTTGVIELRQEGRCVGIIPYHRQRVVRRGIGIQALALPTHPHMVLADVLLAEDFAGTDWLRAIDRSLAKDGVRWQALLLASVLEDSHAMRLARGLGHGALVRDCGQSRRFDCTLPFAELSRRFAGQLRKNLKTGRKKLEQHGQVELLCVGAGDSRMDRAYEHFLRLEASGWKGQSGTGSAIALQDRLSGFYRDLILADSTGMRAEINLLCLDGEPIAGQFALRCGPRRSVLKIAYDEAYRHASPGTVLMASTLERSCNDPDIESLSLLTDTPWMRDWNPLAVPVHDIWIARSASVRALTRLVVTVERRLRGRPTTPSDARRPALSVTSPPGASPNSRTAQLALRRRASATPARPNPKSASVPGSGTVLPPPPPPLPEVRAKS